MKVLHLNASTSDGGAARAAWRVHEALSQHADASLWRSGFRAIAGVSQGIDCQVGPPDRESPVWRRLRPRLTQYRKWGWVTGNPALHSIAWPNTGLGEELNDAFRRGAFDVLNLHWLGDSTLSIEEIGQLSCPVVWTLHDQWAFSGSEHYAPLLIDGPSGGVVQERFVGGYARVSCPPEERSLDLNRHTWLRKFKAWKCPLALICPSQWMADCAGSSALMAEWPRWVIPNPLDLQCWTPLDQAMARDLLRLPHEVPLVLFGAMGGTADPRKGSDCLLEALHRLAAGAHAWHAKPHLVIFGESQPEHPLAVGLPVHYLGHLHDDVSLRLAYAAADLMVVPSRLDNLPNTATEAMACGTPVVAFRTGGLPEIVDDGVSGCLAEPFDAKALAHCMESLLLNSEQLQKMGDHARQQAERLWNPQRIASLYVEVYNNVVDRHA